MVHRLPHQCLSRLPFSGSVRRRCLFSNTSCEHKHQKARVVVVGGGRMGTIRTRLIRANPRFELVGVVDPLPNVGRSLAETYGVDHYLSLSDAISDANAENKPLDGAVICSPTFTHADTIYEAVDNNISVFTEKPIDATAEKIEAVFHYVNNHKNKTSLCCGFQRRFDPSYLAVTQAVLGGQVGTPIVSNIFFADHPCPPREFLLTGGNIFMDLSAHDVDYITLTFDDVVISVYATGTSSDKELEAVGVHDNATMVMNFAKGAVATLFMSRSAAYGYDQRCEIFGTKGLVSVGNVHTDTKVLSDESGIHLSRLQHSFPQRFNEAFASEMDAFADNLLSGTPWPVTAEQCIRVQRVADAAALSAQTGQVVRVEPYSVK